MDITTANAVRRLRLGSTPEAVSFLLLLVASVLKRTTEFNPVPVLGAVHGFLFVLYVLFLLDAWYRAKWPVRTAGLYFALAVLPGGGFLAERMLRRDVEERVAGANARSEKVASA